MALEFYNRKNKAMWVLKMDAGLVCWLQEDDEKDEEREKTGRKKKVKIKIIF